MIPSPAFDPDGITEGLEKLGDLIAQTSSPQRHRGAEILCVSASLR
jgi:hypothetical protein